MTRSLNEQKVMEYRFVYKKFTHAILKSTHMISICFLYGHLTRRVDSLEKTLMLGGIGGKEEKGTTEDEIAGWHHQLDGREFE